MLLLLLLFRILSSTAEDFFSPILTQLSQELGLPPRFAGGELPELALTGVSKGVQFSNVAHLRT